VKQLSDFLDSKMPAVWSKATNFVHIAMPRGRLARRATCIKRRRNSNPGIRQAGWSEATERNAAWRLACRAARIKNRKTPKKINVLSRCGAKRQILSKKKCREADHVLSGSHQEQIAFDVDKKSQAVCREATKRTKRPSGNRTAFSFKGE